MHIPPKLETRYKHYHLLLRISLIMTTALVLLAGFALEESYAATRLRIPEKLNTSVRDDLCTWAHIRSNQSGVPAIISRGIRSDTEKVTRVIESRIKGFRRLLTLDLSHEVSFKYERYAKGAKKGSLYRVFKPEIKHTKKTARYLGVLRLSVSPKVSVSSYGINKAGQAYVILKEQTVFTLPRQFPLKQSSFIELLRKAFKIQSVPVYRSYILSPNKGYGSLSVHFDYGR